MQIQRLLLFTTLLAPVYPALAAEAQAAPAATSTANPVESDAYKLTFIIRELTAGKVVGSRTYSALYINNEHADSGAIRSGDRVPVSSGGDQYQYQDVGVSIDFRSPGSPHVDPPAANKLVINVSADITNLVPSTTPGERGATGAPLHREQRWNSNVLLDLGKPTLLFSSDDPVSDRTTQVEVTAVRIQ